MSECSAVRLERTGVRSCNKTAAYRLYCQIDDEHKAEADVCPWHLAGAVDDLDRRYSAAVVVSTLAADDEHQAGRR